MSKQSITLQEDNRNINLGLLGIGVFVTRFASHDAFGGVAIIEYLKTTLHLGASELSSFLAAAALALCAKPFLAILVERRIWRGAPSRDIVLYAGALGAGCWMLAFAVSTYKLALLCALLFVSTANVVITIVLNGALAIEGRRSGVVARVSAVQKCGITAALVLGLLVSGQLAKNPFLWTCIVGGILMLGLSAVSRILPNMLLDASAPAMKSLEPTRPAFRAGMGKLVAAAVMTGLFSIAPAFDTLLYFHRRDTLLFTAEQIGPLRATNAVACFVSALCYPMLGSRLSPRARLSVGIGLFGLSLLVYLRADSYTASLAAEFMNGLLGMFGLVALQELAIRGAPRGHEILGVACVLGVAGVAYHLSDVIGTALAQWLHLSMSEAIIMCAIASTLTMIVVPFLPDSLFADAPEKGGGESVCEAG